MTTTGSKHFSLDLLSDKHFFSKKDLAPLRLSNGSPLIKELHWCQHTGNRIDSRKRKKVDEDNNNRTETTEEHISERPPVYDSNIQTPYVTVSTQSVARDRTAIVLCKMFSRWLFGNKKLIMRSER